MRRISLSFMTLAVVLGVLGFLSSPALCLSTINVNVLHLSQTYDFRKNALTSGTLIRLLQEQDGFGFDSTVSFDFVFFQLPSWTKEVSLTFGTYSADVAPSSPLVLGSGVSNFFGAENINSYLVHFDPNGLEAAYIEATINFETERILAIIVNAELLDASDSTLGNGSTYPTNFSGRGLETSSIGYLDTIEVSERSITLDFAADKNGLDQIRILTTSVPEPTTLLLLGSGLIVLAGLSRKKFFKK